MNVSRFRGGVAELGPLVAASQAEGFGFVARLAEELARGRFDLPNAILFGAYDGDTLLGVGGLTPDPYTHDDTSVGRLRHLYVLPCYRRQGVAKALVTVIIAAGRQPNRVLRLGTTNPEADLFYLTLGFVGVTDPDATHVLTL